MKNYLDLVNKYLSAHKKKTRLTLISIAISVTLITGIFSMLEAFLRFEKLQIIHDYGNFHVLIVNASSEERAGIISRLDVNNAGRWKDLGAASINGIPCALGAVDSQIAPNFNIHALKGSYPSAKNQIMLEEWALERLSPNLAIGDSVEIALPEKGPQQFIISGIYNDLGNMKAKGVPGVLLAMDLAKEIPSQRKKFLLLSLKNGQIFAKLKKKSKTLSTFPMKG